MASRARRSSSPCSPVNSEPAANGLMPKAPTSHFFRAGKTLSVWARLLIVVNGKQTQSICGKYSIMNWIQRRSCEENPTARALPCFLAVSSASTISCDVSKVCRPPGSKQVIRHRSVYSCFDSSSTSSSDSKSFLAVRYSSLRTSLPQCDRARYILSRRPSNALASRKTSPLVQASM